MGETSADIALRERSRPKLVVRHKGDRLQHRSKIVIDILDFFCDQPRALKQICLTLPEH